MRLEALDKKDNINLLITIGRYVAGACMIAATGIFVQDGSRMVSVFPAVLLCMLAAEIIKCGFTGRHLTVAEAMQDAIIAGALAYAATPELTIWKAPDAWHDLLTITSPTAAIACILYLVLHARSTFSKGQHISLGTASVILVVPFLFNCMLLLQSPRLLEQLGSLCMCGTVLSPDFLQWTGKSLVLIFINEAVANSLILLLAGRLLRDMRMHILLIASGLFASVTPTIAHLGTGTALAMLPPPMGAIAAVAAAIVSQAGLWAETFLLTGIIIDALHSRHPVWYWGPGHFKSGFVQGAVYSGVFMGLIHIVSGAISISGLWFLLVTYPIASASVAGILLFPLVKTIIESFEGSLKFFVRLRNNYARWDHCLRGGAVGAAIAFALREGLPFAMPPYRFAFGLAAGAIAYAGVNLLRDFLNVKIFGQRLRMQAPRIYLSEAIMGGIVGGALCWYFDNMQTGVVATKFKSYAILSNAAAGLQTENYIIYPLFSKWGAMNLGSTGGGVRLFYNESLSGVINWSIAAPLFSINLVALTALIQRSTMPLRNLFTRQGLVVLVEQAFRVQRWGLWMAPVIYSFLRLSPDPTWYNQDGAIRTATATLKYLTSTPEAFRFWSLQTFTNLLAYDWLRIAIFIDHMGLRVATLVNLSFVGMDVVDEKIARFFGHSMKTRAIPSGLRRFVTWAPLLIPFYIPRGNEWHIAWDGAELIARTHPQVLFPPALIAGSFLILALCAGVVLLGRLHAAQCKPAQLQFKPGAVSAPNFNGDSMVIHNGFYTLTLAADGRGWSSVFSCVRRGQEIDITRRLHDPLQWRGKFFYFKDLSAPVDDPQRLWSLTFRPTGKVGPDYGITRIDRSSLRIVNTFNGIRAQATISIDFHDPVELWKLRLTNLELRNRTVELTSYREFALNVSDAYLRHPDFNSLHIGTWFIPALNAIIAQNRLLKDTHKDPTLRKISPEVAFHAVGRLPVSTIKILGYEDSRQFFIGHGSVALPDSLEKTARCLSDDGLLYTFDPAASLRLQISLAPASSIDLVFADGYAGSMKQAQELIQKHLLIPVPPQLLVQASLEKRRTLQPCGVPADEPVSWQRPEKKTCFCFSPDGTELHAGWDTSRPWTHVIAHSHGYGVVLNNEGELYSFMGNSQQNGITPFSLNNVPVQVPGQALYLYNLKTGTVDGPTFLPFRRKDDPYNVIFGRGYAVYQKQAAEVDLEYTIFVLPDEPAEVRILKIKNKSVHQLSFRVVPYFQIMLGEIPLDTRGKILAHYDETLQALFFSNPQNDFYRGHAFVATSLPVETYETVRARFVGGAQRDFTCPFMAEYGVSDKLQPDDGFRIASFAGTINVAAGAEETVVIVIGQTPDINKARMIITTYRDRATASAALHSTKNWWADMLSVMRIQTSDQGFDRMVNDWLPYQVLAAHLWGRIGPNQRSGGYGYRDQLQDMLPLLYLYPEMARRQILLHAGQQFFAGDVMQWWHQSWEDRTGLGVRNRASDPHLWLPYLVYQYAEATGDLSILDEELCYLEGRRIPRDREGIMFAPRPSRDREPLYQHCIRAIDLTLERLGQHGLPLIGTGDWNDGLNLVGYQGRGESIWLGFFLYDVLVHFAPFAGIKEGRKKEQHYLAEAQKLRSALNSMWRNGRYVRAVTDRGEEMVFDDALTASWPVISGAVDFDRAVAVMERALRHLEKEHLVLLLSPAFTECSQPNPGKIADYPPGVRENGGQYSHGASWLVDALVRLSTLAHDAGETVHAEQFLKKALEIWIKISPLDDITPDNISRYGLPPHQQAADVYCGDGYVGRGGWSWYTGAAARMLWAAYKILGLKMQNGDLVIPNSIFVPKGAIKVNRLLYKGVHYTVANYSEEEVPVRSHNEAFSRN